METEETQTLRIRQVPEGKPLALELSLMESGNNYFPFIPLKRNMKGNGRIYLRNPGKLSLFEGVLKRAKSCRLAKGQPEIATHFVSSQGIIASYQGQGLSSDELARISKELNGRLVFHGNRMSYISSYNGKELESVLKSHEEVYFVAQRRQIQLEKKLFLGRPEAKKILDSNENAFLFSEPVDILISK